MNDIFFKHASTSCETSASKKSIFFKKILNGQVFSKYLPLVVFFTYTVSVLRQRILAHTHSSQLFAYCISHYPKMADIGVAISAYMHCNKYAL